MNPMLSESDRGNHSGRKKQCLQFRFILINTICRCYGHEQAITYFYPKNRMGIFIRPWTDTDAESLVKYADNILIWNNLRDYFPSPYTPEHAHDWLEKTVGAEPLINFAIDLEGEAIGGVGLILNGDVYALSAEVSYWVGEPFWGKGIATEAVRQLTEYTFYYFNIVRLYAEVFETNKSSMRVLEKNGYYLEGLRRKAVFKNNVLMDDYIWVKIRPW
jgi:RimJ/RimL family protein N-acetyltransferase